MAMADDPAAHLYGLDLEEFIGARDALAKELRAGGDRDGAAAVKKLAKPTRAAWAVNRLVRDRPDEIAALVEAGAALAGAQEQLLDGADADVLRSAAVAARALVDALAAEAPVDGAARDKVRATLHAATVDAEVRAEVAAGRVVKERSAAGFGGLDALIAAGRGREDGGAPAKPAKRRGTKGRAAWPSRSRSERTSRRPSPRAPTSASSAAAATRCAARPKPRPTRSPPSPARAARSSRSSPLSPPAAATSKRPRRRWPTRSHAASAPSARRRRWTRVSPLGVGEQ